MSLSEQTLHALQALTAQDKALLAQLQTADDAAQAAAIMADAAAKNGIQALEADIAKHFEEASQTAASQALSDSQLEAVAGGLNDDGRMALLSVFTLGIGCALISIGQAAGGKHADGTARYLDKKFC